MSATKQRGRLMPQARYAPELSGDEQALLAAMDDEHKLTMSHAIRLAIIEVRNKDLALLKSLLAAWDSDQFEGLPEMFERARVVIDAFERFKAGG